MKEFLKIIGISTLCILVGYLFAHYVSKGSLERVEDVFVKKTESALHKGEKLAEELKGPFEKEEKKADSLLKDAEKDIDPHKAPPKKEDKEEELSLKLLGSLWPIQKRQATPQATTTGSVYMDGTSPYGISSSQEDELLAPQNLLHLEKNIPPKKPSNTTPFKVYIPFEKTPFDKLFWVQLGAFDSLKASQKATRYFISRGYDVEAVHKPDPSNPSPLYFVRLRVPQTEKEGAQKIWLLRMREKVFATLVPCA